MGKESGVKRLCKRIADKNFEDLQRVWNKIEQVLINDDTLKNEMALIEKQLQNTTNKKIIDLKKSQLEALKKYFENV